MAPAKSAVTMKKKTSPLLFFPYWLIWNACECFAPSRLIYQKAFCAAPRELAHDFEACAANAYLFGFSRVEPSAFTRIFACALRLTRRKQHVYVASIGHAIA